jgi:hypothetical protein
MMHVFRCAHASLKEAKQVEERSGDVAAGVAEMGLRGRGWSH